MIFKLLKRQKPQPEPKSQPTQLWTDISTKQQETMKGGYPWPGFPPKWPPGGGGNNPDT